MNNRKETNRLLEAAMGAALKLGWEQYLPIHHRNATQIMPVDEQLHSAFVAGFTTALGAVGVVDSHMSEVIGESEFHRVEREGHPHD